MTSERPHQGGERRGDGPVRVLARGGGELAPQDRGLADIARTNFDILNPGFMS